MALMLQGSGTGEYKMEEHEAVEDRGVAAVQDRKKLCSACAIQQANAMTPERTEATGRVKRPRRSSAPPINSTQPAIQDIDDDADAGQDQEQQHPRDLIAYRCRWATA
jgi:hypothetical protein